MVLECFVQLLNLIIIKFNAKTIRLLRTDVKKSAGYRNA